jgi:hypothetical protein
MSDALAALLEAIWIISDVGSGMAPASEKRAGEQGRDEAEQPGRTE